MFFIEQFHNYYHANDEKLCIAFVLNLEKKSTKNVRFCGLQFVFLVEKFRKTKELLRKER